MKISDYIIMSDVDGTLIPTPRSPVPERNIEALRRFTSQGGKFGIATGRSKELTEEFVNLLPVNIPCIVYNGGALYDYKNQKFIMQEFLPETARHTIKAIRDALPNLPIFIICRNNYYHVNYEIPFANFSEEHRENFRHADIDSLESPWYKVLFSLKPEEAEEFDGYLSVNSFPGVRFVHTNPGLVEMLPAHITKGYALRKLSELCGFQRESVAAIGDYYNDREMIEYAAVGAVTANAPDDLKALAAFTAGSCENGAVADLVEYLESIAD